MSLSAPPSLLGRGSTVTPTINGEHGSSEDIEQDSINGNSDNDDVSDEEISVSVSPIVGLALTKTLLP